MSGLYGNALPFGMGLSSRGAGAFTPTGDSTYARSRPIRTGFTSRRKSLARLQQMGSEQTDFGKKRHSTLRMIDEFSNKNYESHGLLTKGLASKHQHYSSAADSSRNDTALLRAGADSAPPDDGQQCLIASQIGLRSKIPEHLRKNFKWSQQSPSMRISKAKELSARSSSPPSVGESSKLPLRTNAGKQGWNADFEMFQSFEHQRGAPGKAAEPKAGTSPTAAAGSQEKQKRALGSDQKQES